MLAVKARESSEEWVLDDLTWIRSIYHLSLFFWLTHSDDSRMNR